MSPDTQLLVISSMSPDNRAQALDALSALDLDNILTPHSDDEAELSLTKAQLHERLYKQLTKARASVLSVLPVQPRQTALSKLDEASLDDIYACAEPSEIAAILAAMEPEERSSDQMVSCCASCHLMQISIRWIE